MRWNSGTAGGPDRERLVAENDLDGIVAKRLADPLCAGSDDLVEDPQPRVLAEGRAIGAVRPVPLSTEPPPDLAHFRGRSAVDDSIEGAPRAATDGVTTRDLPRPSLLGGEADHDRFFIYREI